jgi:hypothetical protein
MNTIQENTLLLFYTSKDSGLEINTEKMKCMFMCPHQITRHTHTVKITDKLFENVADI